MLLSVTEEGTATFDEAERDTIVSEDNLLLTLSVRTKAGNERVYKFYPYSDRRVYYTVNGSGEFYVNRTMLDKVIADVRRVQAGEPRYEVLIYKDRKKNLSAERFFFMWVRHLCTAPTISQGRPSVARFLHCPTGFGACLRLSPFGEGLVRTAPTQKDRPACRTVFLSFFAVSCGWEPNHGRRCTASVPCSS